MVTIDVPMLSGVSWVFTAIVVLAVWMVIKWIIGIIT